MSYNKKERKKERKKRNGESLLCVELMNMKIKYRKYPFFILVVPVWIFPHIDFYQQCRHIGTEKKRLEETNFRFYVPIITFIRVAIDTKHFF
jgi:hypothetical protein